MNLLQAFKEHISREDLLPVKSHLLIAVSGGLDSVVLCDLCHKAGYVFSVAHVNFKLRREESDADEQFVRLLAKRYGSDIFVRHFNTTEYADQNGMGIQEAARKLRYDWFAELSDELKTSYACPVYVLTAHHANDQVETLLMHFFKGTGIRGLQGMSSKGGVIPVLRRPLLFAEKSQLLSYADINGLNYRNDSSNESNDYTRNHLRNKLIPGLQELFPDITNTMISNIARFRDIGLIYHQAIEQIHKKLLEKEAATIRIPVLKLRNMPAFRTVLFEAIRPFGFTSGQLDDVVRLLGSESGKFVASATHRIFRNRKWLLITETNGTGQTTYLMDSTESELIVDNGRIQQQYIPAGTSIDPDPNIAMLDASSVGFPLLIRKWKQGDYFYPLGMKKKKKLSRFFIDQKLSVPQKEKIWVIESGKKIVWVIGMRIDDRCKVGPGSTGILKLSWKAHP